MFFRRPLKFWPVAITLAGVGTMLALGVWQLQRLEWKQQLITQLEAAQDAPVLQELPKDSAQWPSLEFRKAKLRGQYVYKDELHLAGRYYRGELGYHVLTPLRLTEGGEILVDRGWVPVEKKEQENRPESLNGGLLWVEGVLRSEGLKQRFMPAPRPEDNLWFGYDFKAFSAHLKRDMPPILLLASGEIPSAPLPHPSESTITLRNDHLGYAITWFAVALAGAVIFVLYHRKPA